MYSLATTERDCSSVLHSHPAVQGQCVCHTVGSSWWNDTTFIMSQERRRSAPRRMEGRAEQSIPPLGPSLPYSQTQLINVFLVKFGERELWVLLFVFIRTGWLIVKTGLIPGTMEKCWLLEGTLRWNMFLLKWH